MSKIVTHGGVVYISGQVDYRPGDSEYKVEVKAQTAAVLAKVDELLAQAGTSKSKVLTASIWLRDIAADFAGMNEVWSAWLDPENKPVRACVQAEMAFPQILVEVQVTCAA